MNLILEFVRNPASGLLGEVLVHFLWQGTLITLLLAGLLAGLRRASAIARYLAACGALALMALLPVATWFWLRQGGGIFGGPGLPPVGFALATPVPSVVSNAAPVPAVFWRGWVLVGWLGGVVALALRLAGGWWHSQQLRQREVTLLGEPWQTRLRELGARLGLRCPVQLLESARVSVPLLLGWLRPAILVPAGFVTSLSPTEVDAILTHELAHLRRHDYLVNLLQRFIEALLFYHPAVWWVSERIRIERENCCDDLAASAMGDGRVVAQALVALAERTGGIPSLALAADGGTLGARVRRLLGAQAEPGIVGLGPKLVRIVGLILLVMAGIWVVPQLLTPKLYVATARMRLEAPSATNESGKPAPYDLYFLQTEFEVMRSSALLRDVVEQFGLAKAWAEGGAPLSTGEATSRLRERVRVTQYRNTALVEVQVADAEAKRAAELANGVVETYRQHRQDRHLGRAMPKYQMLKQEAEAQDREAKDLRGELLKVQEEVKQGGEKDQRVSAERELELRRKIERTETLHEIVHSKVKEFDLATKNSLPEIEVIDPASPPLKARRWRPVRE